MKPRIFLIFFVLFIVGCIPVQTVTTDEVIEDVIHDDESNLIQLKTNRSTYTLFGHYIFTKGKKIVVVRFKGEDYYILDDEGNKAILHELKN